MENLERNFLKEAIKEAELTLKRQRITSGMLKIDAYSDNVCLLWKQQPFFYDKAKIFWFWNIEEFKWEMVDETDVLITIDKQLGFGGQLVNSKIKNNYLEAFKQVGRRKIPTETNKEWIQFKNQVFNIKTKQLTKAIPKYFMCNPIPWKLGTTEETPTIDRLFKDWVGENYVNTLYEIIAYCCLTDYPIHLMFCLVGCGRNGKGQFQKIIQHFIGMDNICSTELDLLIENRFESAKLYKKLVCSLGETNFGILKKTSLLKKLSGGDLIGYEFKNKTPFDDQNYAKIIINSNSLPFSLDTSDGFYRRWLIIDFNNEFPEGKDIVDIIPEEEYNNLAKKITKILPEIINRGKFTNQGTIEERKNAYIMASNPFSFFLESFCYRDPQSYIKTNELYNAYIKYLILSKKRKISRKEFYEFLSEEGLYSEKTTRGGETSYYIDTINIITDWKKKFTKIKNTNNTNNTSNLTQIPIREKLSEKQGIIGISGIGSKLKKVEVVEEVEDFTKISSKEIIFHIDKFSKKPDKMMAIEQLKEDLSIDDDLINEMLKNGEIFEPKSGFVKKV